MLPVLLFASLVLPGFVGGCCWPDRFVATNYMAGDPSPRKWAVDFKLNRYITRPIAHATMEFALHDQAAEKMYVKYKDGSCTVQHSSASLDQCISAYQHSWGVTTLPGGSVVETFGLTFRSESVFNIVTKDGCKPVFTSIQGSQTQVVIYSDLSTDVKDIGDLLQPDVSMCVSTDDALDSTLLRRR